MKTVPLLNLLEIVLTFITCIAFFCAWPKLSRSFWKIFPFYLLFMVLANTFGHYLASQKNLENYNPVLFNYLVRPARIYFYYWLLYKNIKPISPSKARWVLPAAIIYFLSWLVDCVLAPKIPLWLLSFSYTVGILFIVVFVMVFFYYYITSNDMLDFKRDIAFWVCLGLFLNYLFALPFEGLRNTLLQYTQVFMVCWYISMSLIFLMYISFIIGTIWTRPK